MNEQAVLELCDLEQVCDERLCYECPVTITSEHGEFIVRAVRLKGVEAKASTQTDAINAIRDDLTTRFIDWVRIGQIPWEAADVPMRSPEIKHLLISIPMEETIMTVSREETVVSEQGAENFRRAMESGSARPRRSFTALPTN